MFFYNKESGHNKMTFKDDLRYAFFKSIYIEFEWLRYHIFIGMSNGYSDAMKIVREGTLGIKMADVYE